MKAIISNKAMTLINVKTNLIWIYMDQAEKELTDIIQLSKQNDLYKQEMKQKLNAMRRTADSFRDTLNAAFKNEPEELERFGEESDKLEALIKRELFAPVMEELKNN